MLAQGFSAALDDFYPRPPRGGRHEDCTLPRLADVISIHALREEGDAPHACTQDLSLQISIHALREEGDSLAPHRSIP